MECFKGPEQSNDKNYSRNPHAMSIIFHFPCYAHSKNTSKWCSYYSFIGLWNASDFFKAISVKSKCFLSRQFSSIRNENEGGNDTL